MNTETMIIGVIAFVLIVAVGYYSYASKLTHQENYAEMMARLEKLEESFTSIPSASELANIYNHQISHHFTQINPRETQLGLRQHELRDIALTEMTAEKMSSSIENEDTHRLEHTQATSRSECSTMEPTSIVPTTPQPHRIMDQ